MLRNWLEDSKTGQLGERSTIGGGHERPFEEHVAKMVESLGYDVVSQVGTVGYRVSVGQRRVGRLLRQNVIQVVRRRKLHSSEEKLRIVLSGLRGEDGA